MLTQGIRECEPDSQLFIYLPACATERFVGVTSDLGKRLCQHQNGTADSFTKEYEVRMLVYCELHSTMVDAIQREKRLKKWNRAWKLELTEKVNPE